MYKGEIRTDGQNAAQSRVAYELITPAGGPLTILELDRQTDPLDNPRVHPCDSLPILTGINVTVNLINLPF